MSVMEVMKDNINDAFDPNEIEPTDPADAEVNDSVMIALLPISTDWCKIELPHLTLVYCGLVKDLKITDFNEIAKDASMLAALSSPVTLSVQGLTKVGDTLDTLALDIQPSTQLWAMRRAVEDWNASKYPFDPHCTVGPVGTSMSYTPSTLVFDRVFVGWGEDNLTFNLKRSSSY